MTVAQGTFTYYDGEDESCTGIDYGPGESFVDIGQGHVHSARNEGNVNAEVWVTYLDVPLGLTGLPLVRIDQADPGNCAF